MSKIAWNELLSPDLDPELFMEKVSDISDYETLGKSIWHGKRRLQISSVRT